MKAFIPFLAAALLGACTSAEPAYFTLAPVPGAVLPGGPRVVELRRVGLAGYLDRPDLIERNSGYNLVISNTERWGEPLADMTGRVLAEDLSQRLPGSSVFSEAGSISAETDATIEADIQKFDASPDGTVTLVAQIAVSAGQSNEAKPPVAARVVRYAVRKSGGGTAGTVASMSALLGQMADTIATMLQQTR